MLEFSQHILKWTYLAFIRSVGYIYKILLHVYLHGSPEWAATLSINVLPGAQSSGYTQCPLQGQASPSEFVCTTSPYGGSSLVFCCPGAWEAHQTQESNLSIVLLLVYCDISLSGQSDKPYMASPHERTAAASSRCCSADWPWTVKLGFKNSVTVVVHCVFERKMWF